MPPLGNAPQLRLWFQVGMAPTNISTKITIRMVDSTVVFLSKRTRSPQHATNSSNTPRQASEFVDCCRAG